MDIAWFAPTGQAGLSHDALHPLVIDLPPISLACFGHAAISIPDKVFPQFLQFLAPAIGRHSSEQRDDDAGKTIAG